MAQFLVVVWLLAFFVSLVDPQDPIVGEFRFDADASINSGEVFGRKYAPLKSPSSLTFNNHGGKARRGGKHAIVDDVEGRERWGGGQPFGDDTIAMPSPYSELSLDVRQGDVEGKAHVTTTTMRECFFFTLSLWRFMVPLTFVYFAEVRWDSVYTFSHPNSSLEMSYSGFSVLVHDQEF